MAGGKGPDEAPTLVAALALASAEVKRFGFSLGFKGLRGLGF